MRVTARAGEGRPSVGAPPPTSGGGTDRVRGAETLGRSLAENQVLMGLMGLPCMVGVHLTAVKLSWEAGTYASGRVEFGCAPLGSPFCPS